MGNLKFLIDKVIHRHISGYYEELETAATAILERAFPIQNMGSGEGIAPNPSALAAIVQGRSGDILKDISDKSGQPPISTWGRDLNNPDIADKFLNAALGIALHLGIHPQSRAQEEMDPISLNLFYGGALLALDKLDFETVKKHLQDALSGDIPRVSPFLEEAFPLKQTFSIRYADIPRNPIPPTDILIKHIFHRTQNPVYARQTVTGRTVFIRPAKRAWNVILPADTVLYVATRQGLQSAEELLHMEKADESFKRMEFSAGSLFLPYPTPSEVAEYEKPDQPLGMREQGLILMDLSHISVSDSVFEFENVQNYLKVHFRASPRPLLPSDETYYYRLTANRLERGELNGQTIQWEPVSEPKNAMDMQERFESLLGRILDAFPCSLLHPFITALVPKPEVAGLIGHDRIEYYNEFLARFNLRAEEYDPEPERPHPYYRLMRSLRILEDSGDRAQDIKKSAASLTEYWMQAHKPPASGLSIPPNALGLLLAGLLTASPINSPAEASLTGTEPAVQNPTEVPRQRQRSFTRQPTRVKLGNQKMPYRRDLNGFSLLGSGYALSTSFGMAQSEGLPHFSLPR